jgi:hypothetical protein
MHSPASSRRRPQGAPSRAPRRIRGGCAGGDGPRELCHELRVRDAAPHASLTSPLPSPLFTAAMRASEVGQPMRSHTSRTQRPHVGAGGVAPVRRSSCVTRPEGWSPPPLPPTAQPHPRAGPWAAEVGTRKPPLHPSCPISLRAGQSNIGFSVGSSSEHEAK